MTRHNTRRTTARPTVQQYTEALAAAKSAWDGVRYASKASLPAALERYEAAAKAARAISRAYSSARTADVRAGRI